MWNHIISEGEEKHCSEGEEKIDLYASIII